MRSAMQRCNQPQLTNLRWRFHKALTSNFNDSSKRHLRTVGTKLICPAH